MITPINYFNKKGSAMSIDRKHSALTGSDFYKYFINAVGPCYCTRISDHILEFFENNSIHVGYFVFTGGIENGYS